MDLTKEFQKFVGNPVQVKEEKITIRGSSFIQHEIDENQKALKAVFKLAKSKGMTVRVLLPSTMTTTDYCEDRINVKIGVRKSETGYATSGFNIG